MDNDKKNALKFVILMGIVSLFADMVYETSRSIMGPYLGYLGANAFAIGVVFGLGEFLGYFLRIVAGFWIDRIRKYWEFVFLGYGLIISIPLLAFADYWVLASTFIIMERIGKALRSPAKDTLLSIYTAGMGKGLVFGIHETADQVGAVIGPLILFILLSSNVGYKTSFLVLFIPYVLMLVSLILANRYTSSLIPEKKESIKSEGTKFRESVLMYLVFIFLTSIGFIGFPLISFHGVKVGLVKENWIPFLYSLVMVMDSLVAIPIGLLYDRVGVKIMVFLPVFILTIVLASFSNSFVLFIVGLILWGVVMSAYETIVRAFIGDNVPVSDRGKYYGIFNTTLGLSFMIGNSIAGYFYDIKVNYILYFVIATEILSLIPILVLLYRFKLNTHS